MQRLQYSRRLTQNFKTMSFNPNPWHLPNSEYYLYRYGILPRWKSLTWASDRSRHLWALGYFVGTSAVDALLCGRIIRRATGFFPRSRRPPIQTVERALNEREGEGGKRWSRRLLSRESLFTHAVARASANALRGWSKRMVIVRLARSWRALEVRSARCNLL